MNCFWILLIAVLCLAWGVGMYWAFRWTAGMPWRYRLWMVPLWPVTYFIARFAVVQ